MRKNKILVFAVIFLAVAAAGLAIISVKTSYVIPVLMYHSIDYNDDVTKLSVSPESFTRLNPPDWLKAMPIRTEIGHGAKYLKEHPQK